MHKTANEVTELSLPPPLCWQHVMSNDPLTSAQMTYREVHHVSNNFCAASTYDIVHMTSISSSRTGSRQTGQSQSAKGAQPKVGGRNLEIMTTKDCC